jgi:hypothetical protein
MVESFCLPLPPSPVPLSRCPANSGFWQHRSQNVVLKSKEGPLAQALQSSYAFPATRSRRSQSLQFPQGVDPKTYHSSPSRVRRISCGGLSKCHGFANMLITMHKVDSGDLGRSILLHS